MVGGDAGQQCPDVLRKSVAEPRLVHSTYSWVFRLGGLGQQGLHRSPHGLNDLILQPPSQALGAAPEMSQCGEALVGREGRGCRANLGGTILNYVEELTENAVRRYRVLRV